MHIPELETLRAAELETEYADNISVIKHYIARNKEVVAELVKIYHGVEVGSLVTHKSNIYKVEHVALPEWRPDFDKEHKPWVIGHLKRPDGEWSERTFCLYKEWVVK